MPEKKHLGHIVLYGIVNFYTLRLPLKISVLPAVAALVIMLKSYQDEFVWQLLDKLFLIALHH